LEKHFTNIPDEEKRKIITDFKESLN
jgi:hypothetical protein